MPTLALLLPDTEIRGHRTNCIYTPTHHHQYAYHISTSLQSPHIHDALTEPLRNSFKAVLTTAGPAAAAAAAPALIKGVAEEIMAIGALVLTALHRAHGGVLGRTGRTLYVVRTTTSTPIAVRIIGGGVGDLETALVKAVFAEEVDGGQLEGRAAAGTALRLEDGGLGA